MLFPDLSKITIDKIRLPELSEKNIDLEILRLDKIHPLISGNKWFKLKYYFEDFFSGDYKGILTFGGAWSNHIIATACACLQHKIKCVGIIRGEMPAELSSTLQEARKMKMEPKFVSRELYRKKNEIESIQQLLNEYPDFYIIPEGGAGSKGERGCSEIIELADNNSYSHIACAIGTATMFNGISTKINTQQQSIGIPVLKGFANIEKTGSSRILFNYYAGGYAKYTNVLLDFMNEFYKRTSVPTDFVYTGKLCYAIFDLLSQNYFPENSKILIVHSGGLQGNQSLSKGKLIF
jgi:1-aminocyclopropane-1-carboxylate deaminase/D-cysteine desulfhydrase-like pyridoxal-dependent ACC family enzyme